MDWIVEEQGVPEVEDEERELILDYLEANYGDDTLLSACRYLANVGVQGSPPSRQENEVQ